MSSHFNCPGLWHLLSSHYLAPVVVWCLQHKRLLGHCPQWRVSSSATACSSFRAGIMCPGASPFFQELALSWTGDFNLSSKGQPVLLLLLLLPLHKVVELELSSMGPSSLDQLFQSSSHFVWSFSLFSLCCRLARAPPLSAADFHMGTRGSN